MTISVLLEGTLTRRLQKPRTSRAKNPTTGCLWICQKRGNCYCIAVPPSLLLLQCLKRKQWLKISGITFHEDPCTWDLHIDSLLSKAASRLYILRVCKYYGYTKDQLSALFESLIMLLLLYGLEVWGSSSTGKYFDRTDTSIRRAYRFDSWCDKEYGSWSVQQNQWWHWSYNMWVAATKRQ